MSESEHTRAVTEIEHCWIPMPDGTRLSARIWLPADADLKPVPAVFEYLPYRKRDGTAYRDEMYHPLVAGRGYAMVRVDIRGTGESEGVLLDEYLPLEQEDALQVIDWLAAQPWCTGSVGMMGLSWGGFSCLQVAALRPAALKAVISLCASDDRFTDDVHYKGGNLQMKNAAWGAYMQHITASVPDPALIGDDWMSQWKARLEQAPLWSVPWFRHQSKDAYWKQGSLSVDYARISAAVFCVSGLADAYRSSTARTFEQLTCPRKLLMGPWIHEYPHIANPHPTVDFIALSLEWWDHWLKGEQNGVMDEPPVTVFVQDALEPQPYYEKRPGTWRRFGEWPIAGTHHLHCSLAPGELVLGAGARLPEGLTLSSPLNTGVCHGETCAVAVGPYGPVDQRRDDALGLVFDSAPLQAPLVLVGQAEFSCLLASSEDCGQIIARLNAVDEAGASTLLSCASLNLNHRNGFEVHCPPVPGEPFQVALRFDLAAVSVQAGKRLRLTLSTACFPLLWPARKKAAITMSAGHHVLSLPTVELRGEGVEIPTAPCFVPDIDVLRPYACQRYLHEDLATGVTTVTLEEDHGCLSLRPHGLQFDQYGSETHSVDPTDPLTARSTMEWRYLARRDAWTAEVLTRFSVQCDLDHFYLHANQVVHVEGERIHEKTWHETIPRISV
ncbi:CocE/NonD family hydrolase [Pseudomonas putida]|uniref:CocE/NonD family hydrolase n=1 Tax=Pseudomonas putida TaxID=303 RepID=UPI00383BED9B